MKKFILILMLAPLILSAQFTDSFVDGDFSQNPVWQGDDSYFQITSNTLQSNGPNASGSIIYLSTPSTSMDNTEWSFLVDLHFNPTSSTFTRIYLASDAADLKGSLNGYFIHIGNTSEDYIKFYKQSGTTTVELFTGTPTVGSGNIKTRIKITRDNAGNWEIFADNTGGTNYVSQGAPFTDNTFTATSHFGVYCEYSTASRYNLYYFDDFYVGAIIQDTIPPHLQSITAPNNTTLEVVFTEPVSLLSAENSLNYSVNNSIGTPLSAQRDASDLSKVTLTFATPFVSGLSYNLSVYNIEDLSSNILTSETLSFGFYIPQKHDIVFNELMADPSPVVGLPEYEYIELYNSTNVTVNLNGWKLTYGTTEKILGPATIPPDSFIVLVSSAAFPFFNSYGNVYEVAGMSTTALTNAGNTLLLHDNTNQLIHAISYTDNWYGDNNKVDGGWSLEQKDASYPCGGINNWRASVNINGGTPGRRNSINISNADDTQPSILRAGLTDSVTIQVYFSEQMDETTLTDLSFYTIDQSVGNPVSVSPQGPLFESVILVFDTPFQNNIKYKLTVNQQITDCSGLALSDRNFAYIGVPEVAQANDVIINEILSNPPEGGNDFIEIYNRSTKIIDLKSLRLTTKDTILNVLTSIKVISTQSHLIFPGDYMVLSTDFDKVKANYNVLNPFQYVNMESLPSFNNDNGIVVLADVSNTEIDLVVYDVDMHYPLLSTTKGVSLERIHYDRPSADRTNWHSASETSGFGTPTYKNSQFGIVVKEDDPLTLSPPIFSPDNDGYNDVLNITYNFEQAGYTAHIVIYDANGRLVRELANNELLGTEGTISWDGITDDNLKATVGIYIVYVEVFDINGNTKNYKYTTVLGGKL